MDRDEGSSTVARRVASLVMSAQALVLLSFFAFFVYEITVGAADGVMQAATLSGLILVFAILSGVLGRAWLRGAGWPRTPTIVWNVLLLPVAWSLHDADRGVLAVAVGLLAVAGVVASVGAGPGSPARNDASGVS